MKEQLIELMPADFFRRSGGAELKDANREPEPNSSSNVRVEIETPGDDYSPTTFILIGANSKP